MAETDYLTDLADAIAARMSAGNLPQHDENGFYVFSDADLNLLP